MNNLDRQYIELLNHIIHFGVDKKDRTGVGTKSTFGWQIRHRMEEGFPLLTTKKMAWKQIVTELLWFLRGDTNIKYLIDNDCHIWDGDAYKNYLKWFEKTSKEVNILREPWSKEQYIEQIKLGNVDNDLSDLGPIYGKQWRSWQTTRWGVSPTKNGGRTGHAIKNIDQIQNLINELKTNPDSRRLMVNAWNVGELDQMVLPPCHYGFQVYTRELSLEERLKIADKYNKEIRKDLYSYAFNNPMYVGKVTRSDDEERHSFLDDLNIHNRAISLMWNQRSVDTFLGLPFNIASYGLLLEIIAQEVNMIPEDLIGNLGDCHLYNNHIEQAKEQMDRTPYTLPQLEIRRNLFEFGKPKQDGLELDYYSPHSFELLKYRSHPTIKATLNN